MLLNRLRVLTVTSCIKVWYLKGEARQSQLVTLPVSRRFFSLLLVMLMLTGVLIKSVVVKPFSCFYQHAQPQSHTTRNSVDSRNMSIRSHTDV